VAARGGPSSVIGGGLGARNFQLRPPNFFACPYLLRFSITFASIIISCLIPVSIGLPWSCSLSRFEAGNFVPHISDRTIPFTSRSLVIEISTQVIGFIHISGCCSVLDCTITIVGVGLGPVMM
jgi:hypothetical protein